LIQTVFPGLHLKDKVQLDWGRGRIDDEPQQKGPPLKQYYQKINKAKIGSKEETMVRIITNCIYGKRR